MDVLSRVKAQLTPTRVYFFVVFLFVCAVAAVVYVLTN